MTVAVAPRVGLKVLFLEPTDNLPLNETDVRLNLHVGNQAQRDVTIDCLLVDLEKGFQILHIQNSNIRVIISTVTAVSAHHGHSQRGSEYASDVPAIRIQSRSCQTPIRGAVSYYNRHAAPDSAYIPAGISAFFS